MDKADEHTGIHGLPKPPWLRVRPLSGESCLETSKLIRSKSINTVCESAHCPNIGECWSKGEATFMILGNTCTRNCRFCAVNSGIPSPPSSREPEDVAEAVGHMGLKHAVITSVTRDDLPDGGARQFAETIRQIRQNVDNCTVEVLVPDFCENRNSMEIVLEANPEIFGHNIETVPRLYRKARPGATYQRSLDLLEYAGTVSPETITKSGIMAGLGESLVELIETMRDLRSVGCEILTIGQYLCPTKAHLPVKAYYTPENFKVLEQTGYALGFGRVASAPLVRSSYHAGDHAHALLSLRT